MDALIPFTTSGSLVDCVDSESNWRLQDGQTHNHGRLTRSSEKVVVVMRDGRKFIGVLRSYDQFGESDSTAWTIADDLLKPTSFSRERSSGYTIRICLVIKRLESC
jgi:hypothetical protein